MVYIIQKGVSMKVIDIDSLKRIKKLDNHLVLCLGSFMTLHLGHQALIKEATKNTNKVVGVLSLCPSPRVFFGQESDRVLLTDGDRARILTSLGVNYQINIKFDETLSEVKARDFIEKYLLPLGTKEIYIGEDFHFGFKREGDIKLLSEYFDVHVVPMVEDDEDKISSSRIYSLIQNGDMEKVTKLLGRYYEVSGTVIHGRGNGQKLAFPTANIAFDVPFLLPEKGVYLVRVFVKGEPHFAMANVGVHPTVGELSSPILEVHILDFDGLIYDWHLYVQFFRKIRDEIKFTSTKELVHQLETDKKKIRDIISNEVF